MNKDRLINAGLGFAIAILMLTGLVFVHISIQRGTPVYIQSVFDFPGMNHIHKQITHSTPKNL